MTAKEILADATALAIDLKEHGHHMFVSYSPHVEWIDIMLYPNGHRKGEKPVIHDHFYLPHGGEFPVTESDSTREWLKMKESIINLVPKTEGV